MKIRANFVDTLKRYSCKDHVDTNETCNLILWKNDYKYVACLVEASEDVEVEVKVDSSLYVEVYYLESTLAFIGSAGYKAENPFSIMPFGPKEKVEDIVAPYKKLLIHKGEARTYLFKVYSKEEESASVDIDFLANDNLLSKAKINVNILDLNFIEPKDYSFKVEYWQHPYNSSDYYNVEPFSNEHLEILKEHQLLYKSLGGNGVICSILDEVWGGQTYGKGKIKYPSMVKWIYSKGKWSFDYSILDLWISKNIEWGLDDKFICYSMMPWGNKMRYFDKDKNKYITRVISVSKIEKYKKVWSYFLADFVQHLDEKGWFDKVYIGFDERNNMRDVLDLVASFKNKEGKTLKVSASFNNYIGNRECLDRIDVAAVGLYEVREHEKEYKQITKERRANNQKTFLYTATDHYPNSFALSMPGESYWSIMYALASGNDGFLRWAFDAWVKDPLKDTTHFSFQAGDCFLIYPAYEGIKPCLSYRMLELDAGVRDANKLNLLKKNDIIKEEIDELLSRVWHSFSRKVIYSPFWGVCVHKNYMADEKAQEEIVKEMSFIKQKVDDFAIEVKDFRK